MEPHRIQDIKGLTPAIEPTRSQEVFALNGRNYVFDSRGPRSSFGNRLLLPQPIGAPNYVQGFRLKLRDRDRAFTFTSDSILEWREELGGWRVIFVTHGTDLTPYRWTWGYLSEKLYFCHPATGILVYDIDTEICRPHDGIGVPPNAIAIEINNGVLCVIDPENFSWSAPSDGMNFNPALGGAGFQRISDRVSGYPIMVTSYTRGCLIWATGGVMKSEFTGDVAVFRHRALQTEYRPINSFCTCRIDDDTVVILDERGLFQSRGDALTPFAQLFNEFISNYIQDNQLKLGVNARIEWDELSRLLYVSTSLSYADSKFEHSFVLYPNLDKWGQFSEPHYGILPLEIADSEREGSYYGFVDSDARVRYWVDTGSREANPIEGATHQAADLWYPVTQKPLEYGEDGVRVGSSSGVLGATSGLSWAYRAGYYLLDAQLPVTPTRIGLDSFLHIGLFRARAQVSTDEMDEIITVSVRNLLADNSRVGTGYNITPPATSVVGSDLNQTSDPRDFSFHDHENYVNHKMRIIGTLDGRTQFAAETPQLTGFTRDIRHYSCSVTGVWHMIELVANEIGEAFHPMTFEFTSIPAGRLL